MSKHGLTLGFLTPTLTLALILTLTLTLALSLALTLTLTWRPEGATRQQQQSVVCGELPYSVLLG